MECTINENIDNPTMNPVSMTIAIFHCLHSHSRTSDSTTIYSFVNNTGVLTEFNQIQLLSHMCSVIVTIGEYNLAFYHNKIDTCLI